MRDRAIDRANLHLLDKLSASVSAAVRKYESVCLLSTTPTTTTTTATTTTTTTQAIQDEAVARRLEPTSDDGPRFAILREVFESG